MFIELNRWWWKRVLHVQRDRKTWNTIQYQNCIFFSWTMNNEQWKSKRIEWKQKSNQRLTKVEWKSTNESLKTKGQGTVRLPLKWATAEAARRGARGPNKRTTLMTYYLKKRELKAALNWSFRRAKGSPPKKSTTVEEGKALTLGSRICCCRRWCWWRWRCRWVRTRRANHKSMWQRYSVWGLNPGRGG